MTSFKVIKSEIAESHLLRAQALDAANNELDAARRQAECIRKTAYQEGFQTGVDDAHSEMALGASQFLKDFRDALSLSEDRLLRMVVETVECIIRGVNTQSIATGLCARAISLLKAEATFKIHAPATDVDRLRTAIVNACRDETKPIPEIVPDQSLAAGEMVAVVGDKRIQFGLDHQLYRLRTTALGTPTMGAD